MLRFRRRKESGYTLRRIILFSKKKMIIGAASVLIAPVVMPIVSNIHVSAEEINDTRYEESLEKFVVSNESNVIKNDLYIQFEAELTEMEENGEEITEEDMAYLLEKYDGAEIVHQPDVQNSTLQSINIGGTTTRFVSGGINIYASNQSSLRSVQQLMQNSSDSIQVFSLFLGVPISAIIGFFGGQVADALLPFDEASSILSNMISEGRNTGGIRLTLGNAKAIYAPNAT